MHQLVQSDKVLYDLLEKFVNNTVSVSSELSVNMLLLLCFYQMCIRINGAAQLVDILRHFSQSVGHLLPCGFTWSTSSAFSSSVPCVRDITTALINILAFRVSMSVLFLYY